MANQRILADTHGGLFIPIFYGLLDPSSGILTYCNAGHHPPYHLRINKGEKPEELSRTGIPLGVSLEASWGEEVLRIAPGDLLLLYTDGVVDAHNPDQELFGVSRMLEIAVSLKHRSARHVQDAILSEVRAFAENEPQFDDLTLVLIMREQ